MVGSKLLVLIDRIPSKCKKQLIKFHGVLMQICWRFRVREIIDQISSDQLGSAAGDFVFVRSHARFWARRNKIMCQEVGPIPKANMPDYSSSSTWATRDPG
jgi:hypothetical protein